jgi:hypothetical protein
MTNYQNTAGNMANSLAQMGNPTTNSANMQLVNTMNGGFADPYAVTANPYMGNNPELDAMIGRSNAKITDAYKTGTQGAIDSAATRYGAFNSSGHENATAKAQSALAEQLGANTSNLLSQQYDRSSGLAENQLNRASGAVQNERARQLQAAGMAPGMQSSDVEAINLLNSMGGQQQQNFQGILTAQQQDWLQQAMRQFTGNDLLGNALSRASTGQGQTSQSMMTPGYSPWMNAAGGAASLMGMFGGG